MTTNRCIVCLGEICIACCRCTSKTATVNGSAPSTPEPAATAKPTRAPESPTCDPPAGSVDARARKLQGPENDMSWIAPRNGGYQPGAHEPDAPVGPPPMKAKGRRLTDEEYTEWLAWRLGQAAGAP